jgi:hypothetical protein
MKGGRSAKTIFDGLGADGPREPEKDRFRRLVTG